MVSEASNFDVKGWFRQHFPRRVRKWHSRGPVPAKRRPVGATIDHLVVYRILEKYLEFAFPFRRFQIAEVFRNETSKTGRGRYRSFVQGDFDQIFYGKVPPQANAEIIQIIRDTMFDLKFKKKFLNSELTFSGTSIDGKRIETIEIQNHPWFIGVQYHPEYKSRLFAPHPLFISFVNATIMYRNFVEKHR